MPGLEKVLHEPITWFLLTGALIFGLDALLGDDEADALLIQVTGQEIEHLSNLWEQQMGSPPSPAQLDGLLEEWVREEIHYREAIRLRLHEEDTIIRRRLVQKLGFITEEGASNLEPTDEVLREYFNSRQDEYRIAPLLTFSHVFLNDQRQGVEQQVAELVEQLNHDLNWRQVGDPFMLSPSYAELSEREIASLFGIEFARGVSVLPMNQWQGPVLSAYGVHIVRLEGRIEARLPSFEEVRERVLVDLEEAERVRARETYYQELQEKYDVRRPSPAMTAEASGSR